MDGEDFDLEGLMQSVNNNGWKKEVKEVVMNKVEELLQMLDDLDMVKLGQMSNDEFIEKWGGKYIFYEGDE